MPVWARALMGALIALVLVGATGLGAAIDRDLTDQHWRWQAAHRHVPFPPQIIIIAIDDQTISNPAYGRLGEWPRTKYAKLLDHLSQARVVGLDILFVDPDRIDKTGDAQLAAAIRRQGHVVLPLYRWREAKPTNTETLAETQSLLDQLSPAPASLTLPLINADTLQSPLPTLAAAAAGLGDADVVSDPDGVYRTPSLVMTAGGHFVPHLALAVAALASETSIEQIIAENGNALYLGSRRIPLLDGKLTMRPVARSVGRRDASPGSPITTISFEDAVKLPSSTFKDKIVLVGETATGTTDVRPTALDPSLRGVELNANIVADLLYAPPVSVLPPFVQVALVVLALGLPLIFFSRLTSRRATVASLMSLTGLLIGLEGLFAVGIVPPWWPVMLGMPATMLTVGLSRLVEEETLKRRLRENFARYVPPEQVERIVRDPVLAARKAQRLRMAVLFVDIRDFTPYAEQNAPETVVRQMEGYLEEMTQAVFDAGGMVDKFIGDEVMALFGPFQERTSIEQNLSARAVVCALDMTDRLARLNQRWESEGLPPFQIGIGLYVGEALFGQIGTGQRVQLTALGDTVNTASRLQSATKDLHVVILAGEPVREEAEPALSSLVTFQDRDVLTLRGRRRPVRVFEVIRCPVSSQPLFEDADTSPTKDRTAHEKP